MIILYGTSNKAKLATMSEWLKDLPIEIIGLNDLNKEIPNVDESANSPLENAKLKAKVYYEAFNIPVFSCDSGLYLIGLPEDKQPGIYIRRVNSKELNDEEMLEYYSKLSEEYGGCIEAVYKNAICFIKNNEEIIEYFEDDNADEAFILSSKPHNIRREGFPLDSLSIDIKTKKCYFDIEYTSSNSNIAKGFKNFFERNLK